MHHEEMTIEEPISVTCLFNAIFCLNYYDLRVCNKIPSARYAQP